jgi:hypothetical protein
VQTKESSTCFLDAPCACSWIVAARCAQKVQENEAISSTSGSTNLVAIAAADAEASAKEAFASILQRQEEANAVKQKLLLLQRFEALFRLPGRVAHLAQQRDFEGVVAEYCKGKKLIPVKDHALWAKVSSRLEEQVNHVFVRFANPVQCRFVASKHSLQQQTM